MPNNTPPPLYNTRARAQQKRQREMGEKIYFSMVVHNIFIQILQSIVQFNLIFRRQTTSSSFGRGDGGGGWSLFGGSWSGRHWRRRHRTTPPSFNGEKD
jgi:hypothetical protein